ncbi:hypothetical protein PI124_g18573 [Phytophthora idaei]|nr:hypothetical protein PI124_g18573 [Phytophthora idaei]
MVSPDFHFTTVICRRSMLPSFRLSSLRFILKIDEELGKWLIMRNYQGDAAAASVWEPNNIIVIESSSGSDEDTKAD